MEDKLVPAPPSEPSVTTPPAQPAPPAPTFVGNTNDLLAVIAATIAGVSAFSCLTFNYGLYCLPVVALILGAIALFNSKASIDPKRTRLWGWLSVGTGGVVFLIAVALVACFILFYVLIFAFAFTTTPYTAPLYR